MAKKRPDLSTPVVYPFALPFTQAERTKVRKQWQQRVLALYAHYQIPTSKTQAFEGPTLLRLVLAMAAERFPRGFAVTLKGNHDKTKPTRWTADRKVKLIAHFRRCKAEGLSQDIAARRFKEMHAYAPAAKTLISAYSKAETWWRREKPKTDQAAFEIVWVLGTDPTFQSALSAILDNADDKRP